VQFELSTNGGTAWTSLGTGARVGATADWRLAGQSLPLAGELRARARTTAGFGNGSSGVIESVASFALDTSPPAGGTLTLTPASPVDAGAILTAVFSNWTDASPPLAYTVLIDDVVVSPAGSAASRNVTGPAVPGAHVLKGRVADSLGYFIEVTQNFTVLTAMETWRFTNFGTTANTGDAADSADPDGDGHTNGFEYVAGLVPTSVLSRFAVRVDNVAGQPAQKAIVFGPIGAGRSYVVKSKATLADPDWMPLGTFSTSDDGTDRTVTDLDAGTGAKFYHVEITKP
jgi:hypothetical protein